MAPNPQNADYECSRRKESGKFDTTKEETEIGGSNGSISLELGSFRATKIPVMVTLFAISGLTIACYHDFRHRESLDLPLLNSYPELILIVSLYIFGSLVWGPRFMKNKQPYKLKKLIMAYNAFQVVICSYIFYEFGIGGWFGNYNWICQPIKGHNPLEKRMVIATYLYFLTKILDFGDTLFFVLNKKWSHISVLHIVHHSNMYIAVWFGMRIVPSGHFTFLGFLNSAVHVLMYTYYLLAALGPKARPYLWWKKYLTTIQLVQFVLVMMHSAQALVTGCDINRGLAMMCMSFSTIFFVLFIDFYKRAYNKVIKKKQNKKLAENKLITENGKETPNGYMPYVSSPSIPSSTKSKDN